MSYVNPIAQPVISVPSVPATNPPSSTSLTFIQNVSSTGNIINQNVPDTTNIASQIYAESSGNIVAVNTFFQNFSGPSQYFNNLPNNWDSFISQYRNSVGSPVSPTAYTSGPVFTAFFNSYLTAMGMSTTGGTDPLTGDGSALANLNPPVTVADMQGQFQSAFSYFIQNYANLFPNSGGAAQNNSNGNGLTQNNLGTESQFLANWASYMTQTASLTTPTNSPNGALPSYQQIWTAFGLPASGFAAGLQSFYNQTLLNTGSGNSANGYFIPSQDLSSFIAFAQQQSVNANTTSKVSESGGSEVVVINKILYLLVELIGTLQGVSASQAGTLNFLTRWEATYTDLLTKIPTFTTGDGTELGGTSSAAQTVRNNINPDMQSLQQTVTARQNAVSDQAKSMQSIINQSQTDSNSATDSATAFLTELDTILQAIFSKTPA